jgi:peptidyl-prolyl cis-trans isomerase B (cyclophilin B)
VTSLKDRQRAAARARLEREMSERLQKAHERRKRQWIAAGTTVGVLAVVAIVFVIVNATGGDSKKSTPAAAQSVGPTTCQWAPNPNPSASPAQPKNPNLKTTGMPPTSDIPDTGTRDMTLDTSQGQITISLDLVHAPCAAASFNYLAGKKYFDNTTCHRLVTQGIYVLQCGDPNPKAAKAGAGGPSYTFGHENLPTDKRPMYPQGIVAMANPGDQDANGSQFFIVYKDIPMTTDPSTQQESSVLPAQYTVIGTVTNGMDVVQKVADAGVSGKKGATDGQPKLPVNIKTITVGPVKN